MAGRPELGRFPPIHPPLTDAQYAAKEDELETNRTAAIVMAEGAIRVLRRRNLINGEVTLHKGHDVHFFIRRPDNPHLIIDLQLHALRESLTAVNVTIKELDEQKMEKAREMTSIGNEQTAVTRRFLSRNAVPFSQVAFVDLLEQVLDPQCKFPSRPVLLGEFHQSLTDHIKRLSGE
jgi:hypothetical protein